MELKVKDLKETTLNLSELNPYPESNPMGFEDNNQMFLVVEYNNYLMKKRVPKKHFRMSE